MTLFTPLDRGWNSAIISMAKALIPEGFDVSDHAPQTFDDLINHVNAGKRLRVWSGASEHTIYGDPEVNFAFRAWHDWNHYQARLPFTPEGERRVYDLQCCQLLTCYGLTLRTREWLRFLHAEIIGQQLYQTRFGSFPDDQRAFVNAFLADPLMLHSKGGARG